MCALRENLFFAKFRPKIFVHPPNSLLPSALSIPPMVRHFSVQGGENVRQAVQNTH